MSLIIDSFKLAPGGGGPVVGKRAIVDFHHASGVPPPASTEVWNSLSGPDRNSGVVNSILRVDGSTDDGWTIRNDIQFGQDNTGRDSGVTDIQSILNQDIGQGTWTSGANADIGVTNVKHFIENLDDTKQYRIMVWGGSIVSSISPNNLIIRVVDNNGNSDINIADTVDLFAYQIFDFIDPITGGTIEVRFEAPGGASLALHGYTIDEYL